MQDLRDRGDKDLSPSCIGHGSHNHRESHCEGCHNPQTNIHLINVVRGNGSRDGQQSRYDGGYDVGQPEEFMVAVVEHAIDTFFIASNWFLVLLVSMDNF